MILQIVVFLAITLSALGQVLPIGPGLQNHSGGGGGLILAGCQALGASGGTTTNLNFSGANFIAGAVYYNAGATISNITDNQGNGNATILTGTPLAGGGSVKASAFYWTNPTTSATHTLTVTGTSVFARICYEAWANMATSSILDTSSVSNGGGSANTCSPGSISPSSGVKVIIAGSGADDGTFTIDAGMTVDAQGPFVGGSAYAGAIASLLQTPDGATINPTITNTGNTPSPCWIAAFNGV